MLQEDIGEEQAEAQKYDERDEQNLPPQHKNVLQFNVSNMLHGVVYKYYIGMYIYTYIYLYYICTYICTCI